MGRAWPGPARAPRRRPPRGAAAAGAALLAPLLAVGCAAPLPPALPPAPEPASPGEPPPGVRIFTSDGTPASWEALLDAAREARVVLLGEFHNDEVGHRTRHALLRSLAGGVALEAGEGTPPGDDPGHGPGEGGALRDGGCGLHVVSLEMLETDVQLVVDEYLSGLITRDHFLQSARPWNNHERDYEPYLEVARRCGFPVVAANPPRRYVNRVARLGAEALEALSSEARATLPPLPVAPPSPRYRAEWDALMGRIPAHGDDEEAPPAHPHGEGDDDPPPDPVLEAQNLWDAGMAWAVAEAARAHPEARVIHVAGIFHIQYGTGIPEHLDRYLPDATRLLVTAYPVEGGTPFQPDVHGGSGDFVLLTPEAPPEGRR